MDINFNFNKFVSELKVKSLKELSSISGIDYDSIRQISSGKRPSYKTILFLCRAFRKDPNSYID